MRSQNNFQQYLLIFCPRLTHIHCDILDCCTCPQAYNFAWAGLGQHVPLTNAAIPYSGGLESRVLLAAFFSSTVRSFIECPLELISCVGQHRSNLLPDSASAIFQLFHAAILFFITATEVRQMTGQPWKVGQLFSGFSILWLRTCGLMTTFFVGVDYATRYIPDIITAPGIGPFLKGALLARWSLWLIYS